MDFNDETGVVQVGVDYSSISNVMTLRISHESLDDFLYYKVIFFNLIETEEQLKEARVAVNTFKFFKCTEGIGMQNA